MPSRSFWMNPAEPREGFNLAHHFIEEPLSQTGLLIFVVEENFEKIVLA